jgi:predicted RNA-binding protein with EMAP domain
MPEREALLEKGDAVLDLLAELAGDDRQKRACLRFFRLALRQLGPALALPASLESCVPVEAGTVATVSKHPGAKNLVVTRVDVFGESLQIVTNLVKTRAGQRMKVALVYPAEVMGVLSEAQFVGGEAQAGESGRVDLAPDERQEVRRSLGAFMDGRGP